MFKVKPHKEINERDLVKENKIILIHSTYIGGQPIYNFGEKKVQIIEQLKKEGTLIEVFFDDIIPYDKVYSDLEGKKFMNKKDVKKIKSFVEKNPNSKFLISCYGGFSRSVGLAMFLSRIYDNDKFMIDNINNENYIPNHFVYSMMLKYW